MIDELERIFYWAKRQMQVLQSVITTISLQEKLTCVRDLANIFDCVDPGQVLVLESLNELDCSLTYKMQQLRLRP